MYELVNFNFLSPAVLHAAQLARWRGRRTTPPIQAAWRGFYAQIAHNLRSAGTRSDVAQARHDYTLAIWLGRHSGCPT